MLLKLGSRSITLGISGSPDLLKVQNVAQIEVGMTPKTIYYLPGHGRSLETGLGEALLLRGYNVSGRATVGEFKEFLFSDQVNIIADDLSSHYQSTSNCVNVKRRIEVRDVTGQT